jgi:hypothetical protein
MNEAHDLDLRLVIELPTKVYPPDTGTPGAQLAAEILARSSRAGFVETSESCFVPVRDLIPQINNTADLLRFASSFADSLEVVGGLEIKRGDELILRTPFSSNFRTAADLVETLLIVQKEKVNRSLMVGNDDRLVLSSEAGEIVIAAGKPCKILSETIRFPAHDLYR